MKNFSIDIDETIDLYLQGRLSSEEVIAFEQTIKQDPDLASRVEKQRSIHRLIVEEGLMDIKTMMHQDLVVRPNAQKKFWWMGGAFLVLVSIGIGLVFITKNGDYAAAVRTDAPVKNTTGAETLTNSVIAEEKQTSFSKSESSLKTDIPASNKETAVVKEQEVSPTVATVPEEKTQTNKVVTPVAKEEQKMDPCLNFAPKYSTTVAPSLKSEATGKISFLSSDKKLQFLLNEKANSFGGQFDRLESGAYTLQVMNEKGCEVSEKIIVPLSLCPESEKATFAPANEEVFSLDLDKEIMADVVVYNKTMQEIISFQNTHQLHWNGRNTLQQLVQTGVYKMEIRYKNGEKCYLNVTVFD